MNIVRVAYEANSSFAPCSGEYRWRGRVLYGCLSDFFVTLRENISTIVKGMQSGLTPQ